MHRRALLTAAAMTLGGCLGGGGGNGTATSTNQTATTETDTTPTVGSPEEILLELSNATATAQTVTLTVTTASTTHFETEVTVAANSGRYANPSIDEPGEYVLTVETDSGQQTTYPFTVGEYALDEGTNVFVELRDEEIHVLMDM